MLLHKLRSGETPGTYLIENPQEPLTEQDILHMAQQLARRRLSKGRVLSNPSMVFDHLQVLLQDLEHECFALLLLDTRHRVIRFEVLFQGTLDSTSVYPREVVKVALKHNAAAAILIHNHPSGNPEPSAADKTLTQSLHRVLGPIEVTVLDHIVVGREGCVSLAERGWMPV